MVEVPRRVSVASRGRASDVKKRVSDVHRRRRRSSVGCLKVKEDKENLQFNCDPVPASDLKRAKGLGPLECRQTQVTTSSCSAASTKSSARRLSLPALSLSHEVSEISSAKSPKTDFSSLTVDELRDRLGVSGTEIVVGWDREDLIGVLESLESVIADMPCLEL